MVRCEACTALRGAWVFDGVSVHEGLTVLLRGSAIEAVVDEPVTLEVPRIVSLEGRTLLPGFIDAHVHTHAGADLGGAWPPDREVVEGALKALLRSGTTTAVDLKAPPESAFEYRQRIQAGKLRGPNLLVAGPSLTVSGHTHCPTGAPSFGCTPIRSPEDARRAVRGLQRFGSDVLKVGLSSQHRVPLEALQALVGEAKAAGIRIVAHVTDSGDVRYGLDAGIRAFAHVPFLDRLSDSLVQELRDKQVTLIPTLSPPNRLAAIADGTLDLTDPALRLDVLERTLAQLRDPQALAKFRTPEARASFRAWVKNAEENVRACFAAGVRVVFGTDSGYSATFFGRSLPLEAELMVRSGMKPLDVLRSATSVSAEFLERPELGRIAPGASADLLVVEGKPFEDVAALGRVERVFLGGEELDRSALELPRGMSLERTPVRDVAESSPCLYEAECGANLSCTALGRVCARRCTSSAQCSAKSACLALFTSSRACVKGDGCDPLSQDCPNDANCLIVENGATLCWFAGPAGRGQSCAAALCAKGLVCDPLDRVCRSYCDPRSPQKGCPTGSSCVDLTGEVGLAVGICR